MAWCTHRNGRLLKVQLPVEDYQRLVNIKATGGGTLKEQVLSALHAKWDESGVVVHRDPGPVPYTPPQRLTPADRAPSPPTPAPGTTIYNGQQYRVQRVDKIKSPDWIL